uniref:Small ribosomal subunit protein uS8c n=1 Tax=Euglena archaeoplastidiata TaxID=1188008 RepID=A0A1X9GCP5_9EUGL|nr:ribosomal protein S8 [Euglena archaeoplastidiata]AKR17910.1 ribosomal protein S8 [Euglena archaeoplastidiata]
MSNNDLISDMITRIRNSNLVKARKVKILRTSLIINILSILQKEGFIDSFEESGEVFITEKGFVHKFVFVNLKYKGVKQKPFITNLKRISRPGLRIYVNKENIPKVLGGIGIAVISTSKGLMTDRMARINNVGGEVLFHIW